MQNSGGQENYYRLDMCEAKYVSCPGRKMAISVFMANTSSSWGEGGRMKVQSMSDLWQKALL